MKRNGIIILLLFVFIGIFPQSSGKIKELENKRKETLAEIEITNKLLRDTKKTTQTLLNRLDLLSDQIKKRKQVISLLNDEIDILDSSLKEKEKNIQSLENDLSIKRKDYVVAIQKMQRKHLMQDKLLFILSAENFSQSYRRLRYLKEYSSFQKIQAQEIIQKQEELKKQKIILEKGKQDKLVLLENKETENTVLQQEEKEKQSEISDFKKKEKSLQEELNKAKKQAQALNRQIEKAIEEEIKRAEKEAKKAKEAEKPKGSVSKTEETNGYTMTKEARILSTSFAENRGSLPFPIKGMYKIIRPYGDYRHPETNITMNNQGIDIQTTPNNNVYSVFSGEVTSIFVQPGYNNCIIITHGNYRTIYINLDEVSVKKGMKVSSGQLIGKLYTDPENSGTSILKFQIRKGIEKLNPEMWLR